MNSFEQMISLHKEMVLDEYKHICDYLIAQAANHDNDKVESGYIRDTYDQYFPALKAIEFGTAEYKQFEQTHFKKAHKMHAQNRHHYYNPLNLNQDTDLFDFLEAIVDIRQSQRQYSDYDINKIMKTFKDKGVLDLNIEELAYNTLIRLENINEKKI